MKIEIPHKVNRIIETLLSAGYDAYAVGGCVRDSLLDRIPDDWDITTSAKPLEVKSLFSKTVDTGLQHGTVTVIIQGEGFEVTTYRIDGEYEDGRHPKDVIFTSNLREDLKRRDFTINAMAYNEDSGIIDCFDGIGDLNKGIVRCVGSPIERFGEDALRILRAVRFSGQLGFRIDEDTIDAIGQMAPALSHISAERIQVEFMKLLTSQQPEVIRTAYETGITKVILPEFDQMMITPQNNPNHKYSVGEHTIRSVANIEADKVLRLTMLLHDIGKPLVRTTDKTGIDHFIMHSRESEKIALKILKRLKFDNDTRDKVTRLTRWHDYRPEVTPKAVRRAIFKIGEEFFPQFLKVQRADILSQSEYYQQEKLERLAYVERIYHEVIEKNQCISLKKLQITGTDLLSLGMKPGKEIGSMLNRLLESVLEDPELNDNDKLKLLVQKWL